jgi:hypothetical protein
MNNKRPEGFLMIGLHKLAAQNGDGLVPELYELLSRNAGDPQSNLTEFPIHEARMPGETSQIRSNGDNVVAFRRRTLEASGKKQKT